MVMKKTLFLLVLLTASASAQYVHREELSDTAVAIRGSVVGLSDSTLYKTKFSADSALGTKLNWSDTTGFRTYSNLLYVPWTVLNGPNIFLGYQNGNGVTANRWSSAMGYQNLFSLTSGTFNQVGAGYQNLYYVTDGEYNNVGAGTLNLYSTVHGYDNNVGAGYQNFYKAVGAFQNSVGAGQYNFYNSLYDTLNAVGAGHENFFNLKSGNYNVVGAGSYNFFNDTLGSHNIAAGGSYIFYNNLGGSGDIGLGDSAGYNEMGSNKLYIDNSSTIAPLIYGDFLSDTLQVNGRLNVVKKSGDTHLNLLSLSTPTRYNVASIDTNGNQTMKGNLTVNGPGASLFAGDVGIGTTSPIAKLDVNGNIHVQQGNQIGFSYSDPNLYRRLREDGTNLYIENSTGRISIGRYTGPSTGTEYFSVITDGSALNGNVGIGTTTPGSALQVNGGLALGYSSSKAVSSGNLRMTGILTTAGVHLSTLPPIYANNAAAISGGLTAGDIYRTGADPDVLCVVH